MHKDERDGEQQNTIELLDNQERCEVKACGKPATRFEVVRVGELVRPTFLCESHYQIAAQNARRNSKG